MDTNVYSIKKISDEKIGQMLDERSSFVLVDVDRRTMGEAAEALEKQIKSRNLQCRVYLKGRNAAIAVAALPVIGTLSVGAAVVAGWASVAGIGIHKLVTTKPDYEIAKNLATGTLAVNYKKK